jgi:hypothetical protein
MGTAREGFNGRAQSYHFPRRRCIGPWGNLANAARVEPPRVGCALARPLLREEQGEHKAQTPIRTAVRPVEIDPPAEGDADPLLSELEHLADGEV